jgi:hypothetical protein
MIEAAHIAHLSNPHAPDGSKAQCLVIQIIPATPTAAKHTATIFSA